VAHLTLQINILVGTKIESSESDEYDKHQVFMVTAITTVYLFIRFISSSLFAEMIHRERFKSQRCLYEQSGEEFWSYDLELLVVSFERFNNNNFSNFSLLSRENLVLCY
jgi:hypothetical protein